MDPIKIRVFSNNLYICKNKPKMNYLLKRSLWVAGLATFFLILAISCEKESKEETETIIAPEAIDLGLSVKWGSFNLGATSPEQIGNLYAWGETETKEKYTWGNYEHGNSNYIRKYNGQDGKVVLDPEDDVAQMKLGGKWRMPTAEEAKEFWNKCSFRWVNEGNRHGVLVTSTLNGNSIFLPAALVIVGAQTWYEQWYWTASYDNAINGITFSCGERHDLLFGAGNGKLKYEGLAIRPVYAD